MSLSYDGRFSLFRVLNLHFHSRMTFIAWLKQLFGLDASEDLPLASDAGSVQSTPDLPPQPRNQQRPGERLRRTGGTLEALIQATERQVVHQELEKSIADLREVVHRAQNQIDVDTIFVSKLSLSLLHYEC